MQTIQFIPCTEGYSGTSLRGSIQASFADLKEMFGEPAFEGIGDNRGKVHYQRLKCMS